MIFDVCQKLNIMKDFGFDGEGGYSKSVISNAECEATKCDRKGRCIEAFTDNHHRLTQKTILKEATND